MSGEIPRADLLVDSTGKVCPVPIMDVAKAVKAAAPGQIIELRASDPGVEADIRAWCKATRNPLLGLYRDGALWRAFVRKS